MRQLLGSPKNTDTNARSLYASYVRLCQRVLHSALQSEVEFTFENLAAIPGVTQTQTQTQTQFNLTASDSDSDSVYYLKDSDSDSDSDSV